MALFCGGGLAETGLNEPSGFGAGDLWPTPNLIFGEDASPLSSSESSENFSPLSMSGRGIVLNLRRLVRERKRVGIECVCEIGQGRGRTADIDDALFGALATIEVRLERRGPGLGEARQHSLLLECPESWDEYIDPELIAGEYPLLLSFESLLLLLPLLHGTNGLLVLSAEVTSNPACRFAGVLNSEGIALASSTSSSPRFVLLSCRITAASANSSPPGDIPIVSVFIF